METHDEFEERIRREQQVAARLRLATERLDEAQRERIWAIVEAQQSGLSVRQIAAATDLSSSRVHQLLGSDEAREIPRWLSQRRGRDRPSQPDARARPPGGPAGGGGGPARVSPTSGPASRANWRPSAGAASGWNAWTEVSRSW